LAHRKVIYPPEDEGHICIYIVDEEDRNFKICVYCDRVVYRTDEEITGDYTTILERKLNG